MPSYRLPNFNLVCNMWDFTAAPAYADPRWTNFPVQKYVNPKWASEYSAGGAEDFLSPIILRFPRVDPFDNTWPQWEPAYFEVPAGSTTYYRVRQCEIMHEGFPNEYAICICQQSHEDGGWVLSKTATEDFPPGTFIYMGWIPE